MSGNTNNIEALSNFDTFVMRNYGRLKTHALVYTHNDEDATDLLHDTYLKIKQFIIMSGYTTQRFITHFCKSITNTFIDQKRKKKYNFIDIEILDDTYEEDNYADIEEKTRENEYLCKYIFKYLERNYSEKEQYIFKVYYLYPPKSRMTYNKISQQTGISITTCSDTIKKIRYDLKLNLINFVNNERSI